MTAEKKDTAAFVLDDRTIETRLAEFRQYSQCLPLGKNETHTGWPAVTNVAQVVLGYEAGADGKMSSDAQKLAKLAWAYQQDSLARLYHAPDQADGQLPPEQGFLLTLLGLLETPQALLNQLPIQHRALYTKQMLALAPRGAVADRLTVQFTLADGGREQVLPAGLVLDGGQDSAGTPLHYALTQSLTVNGAQVTDLRWVVRDACVPGGRRSRVVLDTRGGQSWPPAGVRLFGASPAIPGAGERADVDRVVVQGRRVFSPLLMVAGGERSWTVTFAQDVRAQLQAAVSIDNAWVSLACERQNSKTWLLRLAAEGGSPGAVAGLDGLTSALPALRLTTTSGEALPEVKLLKLEVAGATGVHCATDEGALLIDGGEPFGAQATIGSGVNLMSAEWWRLGPALKKVTVTPAWVGLPSVAFKTWYGGDKAQTGTDWLWLDQELNVSAIHDAKKEKDKPLKEVNTFKVGRAKDVTTESIATAMALITEDKGYQPALKGNADFTVQAAWVAQGKAQVFQGEAQALFDGGADNAPTGKPLTITMPELPSPPHDTAVPDDQDPAKWPWWIRLGLTSDFRQSAYAAHQSAPPQTVTLITQQTTRQMLPVVKDGVYAMKKVKVDDKEILLPVLEEKTFVTDMPVPVVVPKARWQEPYLPQWSGIRVDYQAEETQPTQHAITPFGYAPQDETVTMLPTQADLYVGIDGIEAGQLLTLHWQLKSPQSLPLEWQYLTPGERWARLPVQDDTDAFQYSGKWSVTWPGDATRSATSLPTGRMWLRGRARHVMPVTPDSVAVPTTPWLTGLVTNAGTAQLLAPQTVMADHFAAGLPAGRVTQALAAPFEVQGVTQPWPSSGGLAAETPAVFEARVAQRLRHRERALNNYDVMSLLREHTSGLRELAVMSPMRDDTGALRQTVVVMPDRTLSDSDDVLRPGLSDAHRTTMVERLKATASPWLALTCINPDYLPISVSWDIEVTSGVSVSVVDARIRAALTDMFMPWVADEEENTIVVGGAIGRVLTHGAVREVVRQVPGVSTINQIYLNGEESKAPVIGPAQVAVLHFVPREYNRLTLAWVGPEQARFGSITLLGDGIERATVCITLPVRVEGLGTSVITTDDADVYLVDLGSGVRLPEAAPACPGLWAKRNTAQAPQTVLDRACYADPLGAAPEVRGGTVTELIFTVVAGAGTAGVHRLGVVVDLKVGKVPDMALQSAVVGESVTCRVQDAASATL
ncbi:hypothetical protein K7R09_24150 [Serratia ureilytica]|uniref:Baseplate protein J-like domain-containing protein n=1 Tax=Serratia ureilytica TaxID=300181 RepID=A0ABU0VT05_9GAMM|nr:hypothetical protein [Serratia ureilytica]MCU7064897.1 hypothetical protein [Serratia ureilytica]MDQ1811423.1 hypothetical protein [Serratia ureilytica]MDQ1840380.1 hypothetical protein [Serratia ureilytica]MDQ1863860.1 hypothetical protein [Serratia ureilytica]